jgi:hypothetical protein
MQFCKEPYDDEILEYISKGAFNVEQLQEYLTSISSFQGKFEKNKEMSNEYMDVWSYYNTNMQFTAEEFIEKAEGFLKKFKQTIDVVRYCELKNTILKITESIDFDKTDALITKRTKEEWDYKDFHSLSSRLQIYDKKIYEELRLHYNSIKEENYTIQSILEQLVDTSSYNMDMMSFLADKSPKDFEDWIKVYAGERLFPLLKEGLSQAFVTRSDAAFDLYLKVASNIMEAIDTIAKADRFHAVQFSNILGSTIRQLPNSEKYEWLN